MDYIALTGVAIGGAAGSVLRHVIQSTFRLSAFPAFPAGTLLINLLGSFLIGLCAALAERGAPWLRPWLMAGFLGGFTTFSAFSLENMRLIREGQAGLALAYALISVVAGLVLAFAGYMLARPAGA
jgi:fluoride exporter